MTLSCTFGVTIYTHRKFTRIHSKLTYPVDHVLQTIPVCLLIDLHDVCNKHKIRHTCTGNSTVILLRIHHPDMTVSTLESPAGLSLERNA